MEYKILFNWFLTTELSINNTFLFRKDVLMESLRWFWSPRCHHQAYLLHLDAPGAANQNTVVWNVFQNQTMAWWSLWNEGSLCQLYKFDYTPLKFNMEPKVMEVWKMIFLFSWVILRFQPLNFRGVPNTLQKPPRNILTTGQRFIPKLVSTVILSKSTAARNDQ